MRRLLSLCLILTAACAGAGELQVVDDFERGVGGWQEVDGRADRTQAPYCEMTAVGEAHQGVAAARLRFAAGTPWAHMQLGVRPVEWIGADCDRLALWVRGDGSGETLNVMLGNYERRPALCFIHPVKLDFTGWKQFTLPFADFTPAGLPANLNDIVLVQLNVGNTKQAVDVLVDDIVALPAERAGQGGRLCDLDVATTGGWDLPAPKAPVAVDPLAGVPEGTVLPRMLHGVRNHLDLHNPVELALDYAEPGTFAVCVAKTSGYGGSRLTITVDGQEALRKDFPGETETALTQYQGYYAVPVATGRHVVKVDNDGADWLEVESYRLGNYGRGRVSVARDDSAVTVSVVGADGKPLADVSAEVSIAGRNVPLHRQADGSLATEALLGRFPSGVYPAIATARRDGKVIFRGTATVRTATPLVAPEQVAFPAGEAVYLALPYTNAAGVLVRGATMTARVARVGEKPGPPLALSPRHDGAWVAELGKLPAGVYEVAGHGREEPLRGAIRGLLAGGEGDHPRRHHQASAQRALHYR